MLALLAFACFPVLAQAEPPVYEPEIPSLPGEEKAPTHHKTHHSPESSSKAHTSTAPGSGGEGSNEESSESQNKASQGSNPSTPGGGGHSQSKQGNGTANGQNPPSSGVQTAKPVSSETEGDEGSSSPLVPILIAVAVLAAISIGAVVVRQRRQRADGPVTPKAS
ncbi:MAG: hypothetical protein ACM3Q9_00695 [Methanosarcina sp.]